MKPSTTRLLLPEYGRNIQKMIAYLRTIEDRDDRNKQAHIVASVMANIYPHKRESDEFKNMVWDHLFMIAEFDLDIDTPYEKPTAEQFTTIPSKIEYPTKMIGKKQYGRFATKMIKEIAISTNQEPEDILIVSTSIAKFLKQKSYDYNNEYPSNQIIINDITQISEGTITLADNTLDNTQLINQPSNQKLQSKQSKQFKQQKKQNNKNK